MGARLRDIAEGRRDALNIDPSLIRIEKGFNPRSYVLQENREHLDALKASIREMGVRVPLLVRWDVGSEQAILIDGECRLRACLELIKEGVEIKTVPVLQEQAGNEADRLLLAITTNTGKPLSLLESGAAFRRLIGYGWDAGQIAVKTGHTARYVMQALDLSDAPQEVKEMVQKGDVTPALARKTIKEKGDGAAVALKAKVSEAAAKGKKTASRERAEKPVEKILELADSACRLILDDKVEIKEAWRAAREYLKARGIKW